MPSRRRLQPTPFSSQLKRLVVTAGAVFAVSLAAPASAAQCPPGQETSPDTMGHCCWPNQAYSRTRKVCVGVPNCPSGLVQNGETCSCPGGQATSSDTMGHCCWPGQAWSQSRSRCVGVPVSCGAGMHVRGESCIAVADDPPPPPPPDQLTPPPPAQPPPAPPPARPSTPAPSSAPSKPAYRCPPESNPTWEWASVEEKLAMLEACPTSPQPSTSVPLVPPPPVPVGPPPAPAPTVECPPGHEATPATQGRCCWPAQSFSAEKNGCVGTPRCPVGMRASGYTCVPDASNETASSTARERPRQEKEPEEPPVKNRRSRTSLTAGLLLGDVTGGQLSLPIRVGLFTINEDGPFQGTVALRFAPVFWAASKFYSRDTNALQIGVSLALGAGWVQRLGPVELFPHGGLVTGFGFDILTTASTWQFNFMLKGLVGIRFAAPAGDGTKFVLGFDAMLGGGNVWHTYVGVEF